MPIYVYQFVLFTLSCILCIPFVFCFNCNFAERRKQINSIQFNSIQVKWLKNKLSDGVTETQILQKL